MIHPTCNLKFHHNRMHDGARISSESPFLTAMGKRNNLSFTRDLQHIAPSQIPSIPRSFLHFASSATQKPT